MSRASRISSVRTFLQFLPIARKLALIVGLFVGIVACLLVLADVQMEILAAVRAYVGGEGLWSKAQKDAVHYLARYATSQAESDYRRYLDAVAVPLGDKRARLELEKPRPDFRIVHEGFVRGRNHPDDVPRMAMLFRRFRRVSFVAKAIAIWTAGDRYIAAIHRRAEALHREIASGRPDPGRVAVILEEIGVLDRRVTPLEDTFSRTLARGGRWAKQLLLRVTWVVTALLLTMGVLLSWMMLRHITEGEAKYRHLLDAASDAIIVTNLESGVILDANREVEELLGIPVNRIVGMPQTELHPEGERGRWRQLLEEQLRTGRATTGDLHLRHADGRLIPVEVSAAVTELAGGAVVQSIFRDITERKRAEAALRESEERYRDLFENANELVYTHDLAGNFTSINKAAEQVTGYTRAEACRMNLAPLVAPEDLERAREMLGREIVSGLPVVYELVIIAKDGRRVPLEVSTRLIMQEGKPVGVQGIARDITERRWAERERADLLAREQAARAEAELANRAKDEFLATLSHELRSPLSAILIWAQLLRAGRLDEKARARALDIIEHSTKLQARLIEDLLDVSRIIAGKLHLEVSPVDLASTIEAAVDTVRAAADAKGIRIELALDRRTGPVSGDRGRLQQVVWNLVANAVKFTPSGGRVDVGLERNDGGVLVHVRDTGIGIRPEFLPHLFERFRQADSTSTRSHGGLGLGLAIVRHLVQLHGGTVEVDSAGEGQGATFTVRLPLPPAPLEMREAARRDAGDPEGSPSLPSLAGVHVLVVDDERDAREAIRALVERCGARVTTVPSAAAALAFLEVALPDVILCDIGMPEEDGYLFIRELRARARERGGTIPVGALTAYARDEDRHRVLAAGFQVHLAKPLEALELTAAVVDLFRLNGGGAAAPRG